MDSSVSLLPRPNFLLIYFGIKKGKNNWIMFLNGTCLFFPPTLSSSPQRVPLLNSLLCLYMCVLLLIFPKFGTKLKLSRIGLESIRGEKYTQKNNRDGMKKKLPFHVSYFLLSLPSLFLSLFFSTMH